MNKYSNSPFMLPSFIENAMYQNAGANRLPATAVVRLNGEIVGLAPLSLKRSYGINQAGCLLQFWASTDFVVKDGYGQMVMDSVVHLLFKKLRCRLAVLTFPCESPNLHGLRQACRSNNIYFTQRSEPHMSHGVISVNCSWTDFQKSRQKSFRKQLGRFERNLNRLGKWKVEPIESCGDNEVDEAIRNRIIAVEKQSWKEVNRKLTGQTFDDSLMWLFESSTARDNELGLKRKVWFLDINGQPAAYLIVYEYKRIAFLVKTSFVEKYRKFSLGTFVNNAAIKDLFERKMVQKIDLMTNLPFDRFWGAVCVPRVTCTIGDSTIVLANIKSLVRKVVSRLRQTEFAYYVPTARVQLSNIQKKFIFC